MRGELIGLDIEVTEARNKSVCSLKGRVIDETKNTLLIENHGKQKRLLKGQVTILVKNRGITIKGKELVGRAEERIK